jgi:hypothetical protein
MKVIVWFTVTFGLFVGWFLSSYVFGVIVGLLAFGLLTGLSKAFKT